MSVFEIKDYILDTIEKRLNCEIDFIFNSISRMEEDVDE